MSPPRTIGILYPGEMGARVASLLRSQHHRVLTCLSHRSPKTRNAAQTAGILDRASLVEVLSESDVIFSLVKPASALPLAQEIAQLSIALPKRRPSQPPRLYIEANSISPFTARKIAEILQGVGFDFLDGAIHGLASRLGVDGEILVSGARAAEVVSLFGASCRVRTLPGFCQASALKMLTGGLNKGLAALFLELGLLAQQSGMLPETLEAYETHYPGIMDVVRRLIPSYAIHAARRSEEMAELELTQNAAHQPSHLIRGAKELLADLGHIPIEPRPSWSVPELVAAFHAAREKP